MKKLLLLIVLSFFVFITHAQNTCLTAVPMSGCITDSIPADSIKWYSFTATRNKETIQVIGLASSLAHINNISLYSSCSGMPIAQVNSTSPSQDTLTLIDSTVIPHNTYYFSLNNNPAGCLLCPVAQASFRVCIIGGNITNPCIQYTYDSNTCYEGSGCNTLGLFSSVGCGSVCVGTTVTFQNNYGDSGFGVYDTVCHCFTYIDTNYLNPFFSYTFDSAGEYNFGFLATTKPPSFILGYDEPLFVVPTPTPTFTITPTNVCPGDTVTLKRDSIPAGQSWTWLIGNLDSFNYYLPDSISHPLTSTTYTFVACENFNIGTNTVGLLEANAGSVFVFISDNTHYFVSGCSKVLYQYATLNNLQPTFTATNACVGAPVTFNNTSTCPNPSRSIYNWSWNFGDGSPLFTGANPPLHIYTSPGTYTVILSSGINDSHGYCSGISGADTQRVTIYPAPLVTISPPFPRICPGGSVTLTASGANTYVWSTGATSNTITVSPVTNTTYTVTGTDANGCMGTAQVTVIVYSKPTASAGRNDTLCLGKCTTIGVPPALGSVTYSWTPIAGLSNPNSLVTTACPTVTTTYTLIATNPITLGGCSDTGTVTVVVKPVPNVPILSGNIYACDSAAIYAVSNIQAGVTYKWIAFGGIPASGSGTSSNINFYPAGGTLYWTATNSVGCSETDSLKILPCCTDTGKATITITNLRASSLHSPSLVENGKTIYINGTFTVDELVDMQGCDIRMGAYSKIIINPNDSLILETNAFECTHLHAGCGEMWSSIMIHPRGTLICRPSTLIEDGDSAIVAENGAAQSHYKLTQTFLNKNLEGIVIEHFNSAYTSTATNCVFSCRNFATFACPLFGSYSSMHLPADSLLPPHAGAISNTGMDLRFVSSYSENGANIYDNLDNGIVSRFGNLTVIKDTFEHINNNDTSTAISAEGRRSIIFPANTLKVGSNVAGTFNYFTDCTNGVYAVNGFSIIQVLHNTFNFNFLATNHPPQTRAVWLKSTGHLGKTTALISNNTIHHAYTGVECDINSNITCGIINNTISGASLCSAIPNTVGITLNELLSTNALYTAELNGITGMHNGIFANSVYGVNILNNGITLSPGTFFSCPAFIQGRGISLTNGSNCSITGNTISTTFVSITPPSQAFTGIYVSLSPLTTICSNTVKGMLHGINCEGSMLPVTRVVTNHLINSAPNNNPNAIGVLLTNSCVIAAQGNLTHPSDNTWTTGISAFHCNSYHDLPSNPNLSPFWCRLGASDDVHPIGQPCSELIKDTATGFSALCTAPLSAEVPLFQKVAKSKIHFTQFPDTSMNLSKQGLTEVIWNNDSLLADSTLHHFNDSIRAASMGQLLAADTLMKDTIPSHLPGVLSAVNSISPASNIETNVQSISLLHLQSIIYQNDFLTPMQLHELRILANKCPFEDGAGVYEARAMLVAYDGIKIYNDSCDNLNDDNDDGHRMERKGDEDTLKEISVNIYPNPNNGNFTLDYQLNSNQTGKVFLFNSVGQQVGSYLLNSSEGKMTISNPSLTNGVYFYELSTSDNTTKEGKVIIIK